MQLRDRGTQLFNELAYSRPIIFEWNMKVDSEVDYFERSVYSFNMVMGVVGGLFNALQFVGFILYSYIRSPLFYKALINKLFMIQWRATSSSEREAKSQNDFKD